MANFRFYNGGDTISDRIPFDNPNNDEKTDNIVSYYALSAPAKSFFEVPMDIAFGRGRAFSNFDQTIISKWGRLGVVRVDKDIDPSEAIGLSARTDKEAKEIGDRVHLEYLTQLVQDYVNDVEQKKAAGLTVLPAQGYTRHAMKLLGILDPALTVKNSIERNKNTAENSELSELRGQVALLMSMLAPKAKAVAAK